MAVKNPGTAGKDELIGSAGKERIWGYAGDDLIDSGEGRDKVWGVRATTPSSPSVMARASSR